MLTAFTTCPLLNHEIIEFSKILANVLRRFRFSIFGLNTFIYIYSFVRILHSGNQQQRMKHIYSAVLAPLPLDAIRKVMDTLTF